MFVDESSSATVTYTIVNRSKARQSRVLSFTCHVYGPGTWQVEVQGGGTPDPDLYKVYESSSEEPYAPTMSDTFLFALNANEQLTIVATRTDSLEDPSSVRLLATLVKPTYGLSTEGTEFCLVS